ncbi:SDR family oxidoreductase [Geothrix sp. PMB-07]|uniref:SDR family oxidoreductase n=1 Tax=Geothrix sp. PMB-07 TaxID=3068640 RepID=UPI0027419121|nr:SDR family oxidoreductase [Geothrix sp. PMB-07]WLT31188.1 SDR family oxidoreductase [Geothrix sp. PMB-07]
MLLVFGGTGKVGRALLPLLVASGRPVRATVRSAEAAEIVSRQGAIPVLGDLDRPATLREALSGISRLFLLTPPREDEAERKAEVIDLARKAGVAQVVLLSGAGAEGESPISQARAHAAAEAHLRTSGLGHAILRPAYFMDNLAAQAGVIRSLGALFGNAGQGRIAMVDARDIAAVAMACLLEEGHAGATYHLTGPEALSFENVAASLGTLLGRTIGYQDLPGDALSSALAQQGYPAWLARDLALLGEDFARGRHAPVSEDVGRILGRSPIPLRQYLRDHAEVFR